MPAWKKQYFAVVLSICAIMNLTLAPVICAADKPNILVIMGDDIGWFNLGSYNQGITA
jgi:hypothetical protein